MTDTVVQEETPVESPTENTPTGPVETHETPSEENQVEPTPEDIEPSSEAPEGEEDGTGNTDESEEGAEDAQGESEVQYPTYEDPMLSQVVNLLQAGSVPADVANEVFAEAVQAGDLSLVKRDLLVEKVGETQADTILMLAKSGYENHQRQLASITAEVHEIVGGEEVFNNIRDWVSDKESNDTEFAKDMQELRDMLNSGNARSRKAAMQELLSAYKADPNTTLTASLTEGDTGIKESAGKPLSRKEYGEALQKARRDGTYDKVHKQLWAQRQAGQKQGI